MFIGREHELKEIRESLTKHSYQATFIYGRRRVGKTELISQGIAGCGHRILSFEFRKRTLAGNLSLFTPEVQAFFGERYVSFNDFDSVFDYLLEKSTHEEYVLVLDEFSFLLLEDFGIESSLAAAIDKYKPSSKIHLIISGSYVGLMEKMIDSSSHCYGRFNHILPLRPFDYFDSAKFYPSYSDEEKVLLYSVFGGVPFFNSLIDIDKTAIENVLNLVVRADSICEHEINEMVMAETTKAPLLNELLLSILKGKRKYKDILSDFSSQNKGRPDYFIEKLLDMDFIRKVCPISDENNKKKTRYAIKDNLVDFYYRYIFNANAIELRKDPKFFYDHFIKEDFLENYLPHKFEAISREFLIRMNLKGEIEPPFFKIGEYHIDMPKEGISREFDIVTEDKQGFISYECKFTEKPIDEATIQEEILQTSNLPDICFYKLGFISKSGFANGIDQKAFNLFSLSDFYKE